jgi:adenylate cyclase
MPKKKIGLLRHIANLIIQNKSLIAENEKLNSQNELLASEIETYRELLLRTGSKETALKNSGEKKNAVVRYRTATVLYADALGFESMCKEEDPELLVDSLDEIFIKLQHIIAKYEIQNIRTIGDTLMCVGGIPRKNITNPIEVLLAAVEMQYFVREIQRSESTGKIWKLRIGIHTGNVTSTVAGKRKLQYEVKGETVNLAARIRQICKDGQILISASTYELAKDLFLCEYFGKMPVKYQGEIPLYVVKGIRPDFSLQGKGIIPNKKFSVRYGLMQFTDLQEIALDKMEKDLPQNLYYHNIKHTVDVVTQVELIGLGEGVTEEELLLLKTAALFHDTGHTSSYSDHEYFSTLVAREILPSFYYTQSQIETICELIMATRLPPCPKTRLEEIMCDADLDYLGRSDMIPVSNSLYLEMKERSMIQSMVDWNNLQMKFISGHQYFTATARNLREVNKQMQIARIRSLIVQE